MLYRTLKAIIVKGDRIEKNTEIELSADEAIRLGSDLVKPVSNEKTEPVEAKPEKALDDMTLDELKAKAKESGLSDRGRKSDLLERIKLSK